MSHSHSHPQGHAHSHSHNDKSTEEANAEYFDVQYSDKDKQQEEAFAFIGGRVGVAVADVLRKHNIDLSASTLLDYATGNGSVALQIQDKGGFRKITGVDTAAKGIESFNEKVKARGYDPETVKGIKISQNDLSAFADDPFDVALCTLALYVALPDIQSILLQAKVKVNAFKSHHFDDPSQVTRVIANALKPNGHFVVIDFLAHPGHKDMDPEDVHKHGIPHGISFTTERMQEILEPHFAEVKIDTEFSIPKADIRKFPVAAQAFKGLLDADDGDQLSFLRAICRKA